MNNPVSATDPSGLEICDGWGCIPGSGGGGDGGCWDNDGTCDPGGCDPLRYDCDGSGGYIGEPGYGPAPDPKRFVDLDPNHIMTERLGLPAGMRLPSGDLLDIFTGGSGTCEFGACGGGIGDFMNNGVHNKTCTFLFCQYSYTDMIFGKFGKIDWNKVGIVIGCVAGMGSENAEPIVPRKPQPITDPGLPTGDGPAKSPWEAGPYAIDVATCIKKGLD